MFEEVARDGSQMLMLIFWLLIALMVIWGAIKMRAYKKSRFFVDISLLKKEEQCSDWFARVSHSH
jgi:hypothetical protein